MRANPRSAKREIHLNLPVELQQKFRIEAALEGLSIQALVTRLVADACIKVELLTNRRSSRKER